jgi:hypothetical protein
MFEQLIPMLEEQGVDFEEDYDAGTLVINVEAMDKDVLITVIGALNDMGANFTIDAMSLTVTDAVVDMEEPAMPEGDMQAAALDDIMGGGGMGGGF